eukprot:5493272-Pleurochrysis_carterae.AAC.2
MTGLHKVLSTVVRACPRAALLCGSSLLSRSVSLASVLVGLPSLWDSSGTECRFGAHNDVISPPRKDGRRLFLPFSREAGLFVIRMVEVGNSCDVHLVPARCLAVHSNRRGGAV